MILKLFNRKWLLSFILISSGFGLLLPMPLVAADDIIIQHDCLDDKWIATLTDSDGIPLENVRIGTIKKMSSTSPEESFFTDESGFVSIPSSSYTGFVTISKGGYNDQKISLNCIFIQYLIPVEIPHDEIINSNKSSSITQNKSSSITTIQNPDCNSSQEFKTVIHTAQKLYSAQEYYRAIICYQLALDINPEYVYGHIKIGESLFYSEKYVEALNVYDNVLRKGPNQDLLSKLGWHAGFLGNEQKYEEQLMYLNKIQEIDPNIPNVIYTKVEVLEKLDKYQDLIEHLDKYLEKNSENVSMNEWLYYMKNLYSEDTDTSFKSDEGNYYLISYDKLTRDPTVCAFEINDSQLPEAGKILLELTEKSVYQWESNLKKYSNNTNAWNINFEIIEYKDQGNISKSLCDITIKYQRYSPENLPRKLGVAYNLGNGYFTIWIYYAESLINDYPHSLLKNKSSYSDIDFISNSTKMESPDLLEATISHELGHAFGLGHVPKGVITTNNTNAENSHPSIMISGHLPSSWNLPQKEITPYDVHAVLFLYGEKGFVNDASSTKENIDEDKSVNNFLSEDNLSSEDVFTNNDGGCLIATAAYGSEMSPQVQYLREIRDGKVMNTQSGASFMTGFNSLYYSFSPYIADYQRENPAFKELVKIGITPMLSTLSIMSLADTESEIVGYGIGVILLNLGMYVAAPAIVMWQVRDRIKFPA